MMLYLLRFSFSLALVYGFYRLVLEKEKVFVFNRFFLLIGLIISLIVPLISFSGYEKIKTILSSTQHSVGVTIVAWEDVFNVFYIIVTVFFLLRFGIDFAKLWQRSKKGKLKIVKGTRVILTDHSHAPYSFLNNVFITENSFNKTEPELIDHEIAHVQQGHTFDILFVEFVKAFIWINPMLGLFKNSMRLNHEFLADQYAINNTSSISSYQKILLGYFTAGDTSVITSSFNYALTKKRFLMMTKQKSKFWHLRQFLVLPLLLFIFWSCSDTNGVSGKEMLKYWRYTANMEEILPTGRMNRSDLNEGVILPIVNKSEYDELQDIYSRMNNVQKKSVYELPQYLEPIEKNSFE